MSRVPVSYRGKTVVTVHDLAVYKVPDVFPSLASAKTKALLSLMTSKADKIIAVSNSTKKDICEIFKSPEDKIKVIYSGFDKRLFEESGVTRERVLEKYGIKDRYILFLGTLEPIKNVVRLFEAYKIFRSNCKNNKENIKCDWKLVMAGKNGWLSKDFKQVAKDLGIGKDVIFTGYVIGDDLVPLFKNADFFVMPSLYEGFGTTVLEAFATGTPAIVSNVSSLPEIADGAAIFVNPLDVQDIAGAMTKFAFDENLKNEYREKGKKQLEKFDWNKCARETLEVYKSFKKD
jgi:glycosyltransferase involved in cell wall biosynthesis